MRLLGCRHFLVIVDCPHYCDFSLLQSMLELADSHRSGPVAIGEAAASAHPMTLGQVVGTLACGQLVSVDVSPSALRMCSLIDFVAARVVGMTVVFDCFDMAFFSRMFTALHCHYLVCGFAVCFLWTYSKFYRSHPGRGARMLAWQVSQCALGTYSVLLLPCRRWPHGGA